MKFLYRPVGEKIVPGMMLMHAITMIACQPVGLTIIDSIIFSDSPGSSSSHGIR